VEAAGGGGVAKSFDGLTAPPSPSRQSEGGNSEISTKSDEFQVRKGGKIAAFGAKARNRLSRSKGSKPSGSGPSPELGPSPPPPPPPPPPPLDSSGSITLRLPGAAVAATHSQPSGGPADMSSGDAIMVARNGLLTCTVGAKKPRWCVLGCGQLAVYSEKKDFVAAKPPKLTIDLRSDVSKVACSTLNEFSITPSRDLSKTKEKDKKSKPNYRMGEPLCVGEV